jgi:hypothetical protein
MHGETIPVNATIAPLRNVSLMAQLIERVQNRRSLDLPGLAVMCGPSGYGKSKAAVYAVNKFRAYHVEVGSRWTAKHLCAAILGEMGIRTISKTTIAGMVDLIGEQLSLSRRPLIIDEADFLVERGYIEMVRDFYRGSLGSIVLIGEEQMPQKLERYERVHARVLEWVYAVAAILSDARHLAPVYCPSAQVTDDLLTVLHEASKGSVRRICANLDRVREEAETKGKSKMTLADWKDSGRDFYSGKPALRGSGALR